jgi:hypothetical protein
MNICRRWRQTALLPIPGEKLGDPNGHRSNQSATNPSRQPTTQNRTHRQKSAGLNSHQQAAKGNTLLNYAGIKTDLIQFVCDAAPSKQGKYMPGSRVPILSPAVLRDCRPDYVLILPWNIADEVASEHNYVSEWGGRFFVAVPELKFR